MTPCREQGRDSSSGPPDVRVVSFDEAMNAPARDVLLSREAWDDGERDLAALRPHVLALAERHQATMYVNQGGRYPHPELALSLKGGDSTMRVQLAAEPFAAGRDTIAGYRLGIVGATRQPTVSWLPWFGRMHYWWQPLALFTPEVVRAASPEVIAAFENALHIAEQGR